MHPLLSQVSPPPQSWGAGGVPQAPALHVPRPTNELPLLQPPQVRALWGGPLATGEHLPSDPLTSHAWHAPVHALSQQ